MDYIVELMRKLKRRGNNSESGCHQRDGFWEAYENGNEYDKWVHG